MIIGGGHLCCMEQNFFIDITSFPRSENLARDWLYIIHDREKQLLRHVWLFRITVPPSLP